MALPICAELFIRILFELLLFFKNNWLMILIAGLVVYLITKKLGPVFIGLIASGLDIAMDLLGTATLGASTPITVITGIVIGMLWASIVFFSEVNSLIKIINMPFMFILGFISSILFLPIPIALVLGFLMRFKTTNYIIGIIPSVLVILFLYFAGPTLCSISNKIIIMLS